MNRCTCPQWEPSIYAKHSAERQISIDCPIHGEPTTGQLNIRIRELEAELAALREARHLPYCPHRKTTAAVDCLWCMTERAALEPAPVTPPSHMVCATDITDEQAAKIAEMAQGNRPMLIPAPAPVTPAEAARVLLAATPNELERGINALHIAANSDHGADVCLAQALRALADAGDAG